MSVIGRLVIAGVELDVLGVVLRGGRVEFAAQRMCRERVDIEPPCQFQLYGPDGALVFEGDFPYDQPVHCRPDSRGKPALLEVTLPIGLLG